MIFVCQELFSSIDKMLWAYQPQPSCLIDFIEPRFAPHNTLRTYLTASHSFRDGLQRCVWPHTSDFERASFILENVKQVSLFAAYTCTLLVRTFGSPFRPFHTNHLHLFFGTAILTDTSWGTAEFDTIETLWVCTNLYLIWHASRHELMSLHGGLCYSMLVSVRFRMQTISCV